MIIEHPINECPPICNWSPQELLEENKHLMPQKCKIIKDGLNQKFKAYILINLNKKLSKTTLQSVYRKNQAFYIWFSKAKVQKNCVQANQRILTSHPINDYTFFYRIKIFCRNYSSLHSVNHQKKSSFPKKIHSFGRKAESIDYLATVLKQESSKEKYQQKQLEKPNQIRTHKQKLTSANGINYSHLQNKISQLRMRATWIILKKLSIRTKKEVFKVLKKRS